MKEVLTHLIFQAKTQKDLLELMYELDSKVSPHPTNDFIKERIWYLKQENREKIMPQLDILSELFDLFDILIIKRDNSLYNQYKNKYEFLNSFSNSSSETKNRRQHINSNFRD